MITKQTIWLLGAVAVVFGYIWAFEHEPAPEPSEVPALWEAFKPANIRAVRITYGTNTFRLQHNSGQWRFTEPMPYPAQSEPVMALLNACAKLTATDYLKPGEVSHLSEFELAPPKAILHLERDGTEPLELRLGSEVLLSHSLYAQSSGNEGVFVLPKKFLQNFPAGNHVWRDRRVFHLSQREAVVDTVMMRNGPLRMTLNRPATNRMWRVIQPEPVKRGNREYIELVLARLWSWEVQHFVPDQHATQLEAFGLRPPDAELELRQGTNRLAWVQFGHSPTNQPELVYARLMNQSNVVIVARRELEPLRAKDWTFCDRHLASRFAPSDLARIEVMANESFALSQNTNGIWSLTAPAPLPADQELVFALMKNLGQLQAVNRAAEVVANFGEYGLAQPSASFTLRNRGGTNTVRSRISFGSSVNNSDQLYARRHDEDTAYTVAAANRQRLPSWSYQLRDRRLWQFTNKDVAKFTVAIADKVATLERNNTGQWTQPGRQLSAKETSEINMALNQLGQFQAANWTARGDDKRGAYGILEEKKSLTLQLRRDGKTVERKLEFGRRSPRRTPFAMATDPLKQEPVVFEFPVEVYENAVFDLFNLTQTR